MWSALARASSPDWPEGSSRFREFGGPPLVVSVAGHSSSRFPAHYSFRVLVLFKRSRQRRRHSRRKRGAMRGATSTTTTTTTTTELGVRTDGNVQWASSRLAPLVWFGSSVSSLAGSPCYDRHRRRVFGINGDNNNDNTLTRARREPFAGRPASQRGRVCCGRLACFHVHYQEELAAGKLMARRPRPPLPPAAA